jgi:hypothetical protein
VFRTLVCAARMAVSREFPEYVATALQQPTITIVARFPVAPQSPVDPMRQQDSQRGFSPLAVLYRGFSVAMYPASADRTGDLGKHGIGIGADNAECADYYD